LIISLFFTIKYLKSSEEDIELSIARDACLKYSTKDESYLCDYINSDLLGVCAALATDKDSLKNCVLQNKSYKDYK
jgi:hypothetical protein